MPDPLNPSELDEIKAIEARSKSEVPFELFDKQQNKTTKLALPSDLAKPMAGRNDWYSFHLKEPVFVSTITVYAEGYDLKDCVFSWSSITSATSGEISGRFENGKLIVEIDDFISSFAFKPDKKYWGKAELSSVLVEGFTIEQYLAEREKIGRVEQLKSNAVSEVNDTLNEAQRAEANKAALQEEIVKLETDREASKDELNNIQASIERASNELSRLKSDASNTTAEQAALEARLEKQEALLSQRSSERDQLNEEVEAKKSELRALENDIYLFPSELKEFVKRAGEHKSFYWKLASVPMLVIAALAIYLLSNAESLATIFNERDNARLASIFLTRLPYVVVVTAVVGAMFKIAHALIIRIMEIDAQTRALAKISIIATDVSTSSEEGLNLLDEERYHLRTALKMELLRDHLKNYISKDFDYGSSPQVQERLKACEREREAEEEDSILEDDTDSEVDS